MNAAFIRIHQRRAGSQWTPTLRTMEGLQPWMTESIKSQYEVATLLGTIAVESDFSRCVSAYNTRVTTTYRKVQTSPLLTNNALAFMTQKNQHQTRHEKSLICLGNCVVFDTHSSMHSRNNNKQNAMTSRRAAERKIQFCDDATNARARDASERST